MREVLLLVEFLLTVGIFQVGIDAAVQEWKINAWSESKLVRPQHRNEFTCPGDGFFASPGLCVGEYYVCVDGIAYPQYCPADSIFDPETLTCVPPDQASCTVLDCSAGDGFYALPGQCSENYYACMGGIAYPQTCPGGGIFDPETLTCVTPESASCTPAITK